MNEYLVIDLDQCDACDRCGVECAYFDQPNANGRWVFALRERATYAVVCRRCQVPSCVHACPFEALERRGDGVLERHHLRCVSCRLCAHACPFGTILTDMLAFYVTPCDYCLTQHSAAPPCAPSCDRQAIRYRAVNPEEAGAHQVDKRLVAVARKWVKREAAT